VALASLLLFIAGCGYRFTADQGTRLAAGQTVWVPFLKNSTVYPNASVVLKRVLFEQFSALRGITPAVSEETGNLWLEGSVTGYSAVVVSYSTGDTAKEYRLTLSADISVRRKGDSSDAVPVWKGSLSAWQDFPVATTIELQRNSEDAALAAAARKLAQKLIWQMEQNY